MISPILAKLYGFILEKKISLWLESHDKRAKGHAGFRRYHSTVDHLVTFRIIAEEFRNTKTNIFCCFVDFRKYFDMVPRKNLWNRFEEIKVPLELRAIAIRMYVNIIVKFKNIEGWSKEINCNIKVKQGCPLSPTLFGIYIDKLEDCLEKASCVGPTLTGVVINLLRFFDDIDLMARSPHDLENQLRILKDFISNMGMIVNTDKTKVMIIKSNNIPYDTFMYEKNNLEEVSSYKYLGIDIHHKLNWNYSIEKMIIRGWKDYYGLEKNCKSIDLWSWDKKKLLFETLVTHFILYGCELWGFSMSRESWRKIEKIQKNFITYNLKIKGNTPYPIHLLETSISPIDSMAMTRYLMYKNNLNNMEDKRLPIIASKSSHNHHQLRRGWHKDTRSWINYWGIMEDTILQNKDTIRMQSTLIYNIKIIYLFCQV